MGKFILAVLLIATGLLGVQAATGQSCPAGQALVGLHSNGKPTCVPEQSTSGPAGRQPDLPELAAKMKLALPDPKGPSSFGAVAMDNAGHVGYAERRRSKEAAEQVALAVCGAPGCKIVTWLSNQCIIAYRGPTAGRASFFAWGLNTDVTAAGDTAKARCAKESNSCEIKYASCSTNDYSFVDAPTTAKGTPPVAAASKYATYALSKTARKAGYNQDSLGAAASERDALRRCGKKDCQEMARYQSGTCMAALYGRLQDGSHFDLIGLGRSEAEAQATLMPACNKAKASECQIYKSHCQQ